jgi:hypothetical protein
LVDLTVKFDGFDSKTPVRISMFNKWKKGKAEAVREEK